MPSTGSDEKDRDGNKHPTIEKNGTHMVSKKKMEVTIREIEIGDIPEVFHLGEEIFTVEEVPTLYRTWDEYEITSLFNTDREYCMVAEVDDRIVGFALGNIVAKRRSAWKYGYLVWLGIKPDCQRQGVAGRLFDKLAEKMSEDGVRIFLVDTEADNEAALQFFLKEGFSNPEEHIYLTLNLKTYEQMQKKGLVSSKKHRNDSGD